MGTFSEQVNANVSHWVGEGIIQGENREIVEQEKRAEVLQANIQVEDNEESLSKKTERKAKEKEEYQESQQMSAVGSYSVS